MRFLLVDDSRTIRNIQKNILSRLGHTDIVEASDGVEACVKLKEESPEIILLDWNMPNMDGVTFLKKIRGEGVTIPVIMCTTEAEKSRVIQAIQAGANNYVVKPFSTDTMAEKLEQTMKNVSAAK